MTRAALPRLSVPDRALVALVMMVVLGWPLWSMVDLAEALEFIPIVDAPTPIPGQPGSNFLVYPTPPAFGGSKVVCAAQPFMRQLWTANPDGSGLTKLADSNTPIPGGIGRFGDVFPFRISNGTVVFRGNVFVRFKDAGNVTRGSTSVAVTTQ
jgi:hypothetical protein